MHDVFVSYSSLDKPTADAIVHYLEEREIRCWYAPRDIKAGEKWEERIMDAIQDARIFVLIYSQRSNVSKQVMNEVGNACSAGCVVIPFRLDESQMSKGLAYYLHSVHWLDATNDDLQANAAKLCTTVKAILGGEQPPQPPKRETPTPPAQPEPPKRKNAWKRILAFVLAVMLAAGGFFLAKNAPQDAYFFCISHIGLLFYPGFGDMLFSSEREQIVLQDRSSGQLVSVSVENPYSMNWEAENRMENPLETMLIQTAGNPYAFFVDNLAKEIDIFNRERWEWVAENVPIAGLKESEVTHSYFYFNPHILADSESLETAVILFYDADPEVDCLSKIVTVSPEGITDLVDISHLNLINLICVFENYGENAPVLMMDRKKHPVLIDLEDGNVISTDMHTIYEEYLPNAAVDHYVISPNKRYVIFRDMTYDTFGDRLTVWDMKTGNRVFTHEEPLLCDIYFTDDNMLIYYDHLKKQVFSLDPEGKGKPVCLMDEDDFERGKRYLDVITSFYYSPEQQVCFFVSVSPGFMDKGRNFMVTATDAKGKVLAKSDKIFVENWNVSSSLYATEEAVILTITPKNDGYATDEEHTAIYRALYTVDVDGKLQFKDSYNN